ncbi:MAG TPA: glycosyltransferase [Solirubrobacteraceae bacterium]|nr:glycosyltransferase [Solirubrobacteraceae bacterium]
MDLRVGHVIDEFLRYSETFVYTQLRLQPPEQVAVLTRRRVNADRFPCDRVHELDARAEPRYVAALRRRLLRLSGVPSRFQRGIAQAAAEQGCTALHAHFGWSGIDCLHAVRRLGLPLLTALHGKDVYAAPGARGSGERHYRELFARGSMFTCVGPNARAHLAGIGCPEERLRIVKVGIDLEAFAFRPAPPREPLVVLQVGRLAEKKGVDVTLRAFADALAELGDAELWLAGDGSLRPSLERLAAELGIADRVRFLGALPHDEVIRRVERANIGIQPSRVAADGDREGSPTVLIEMQAMGVPVVATRHADIPAIVAAPDELVDEDDVGALARRLVAVARLDGEALEARRRRGRELVEREHDARRIATQLEGLYAEMAAGYAAAPMRPGVPT